MIQNSPLIDAFYKRDTAMAVWDPLYLKKQKERAMKGTMKDVMDIFKGKILDIRRKEWDNVITLEGIKEIKREQ